MRLVRRMRHGSLLICVMVVLLLVGLVVTQTVQTMLVLRRSDESQSTLHQARELLEVGKLLADQVKQTEEFTIEVTREESGLVLVELPTQVGEETRVRVTAKYPVGSDREVTVTWESRK